MSRVDDDRQAQRLAERLMLEKRQQEQRTQDKSKSGSTFAALIQDGQAQKAQGEKQQHTARAHGEHAKGAQVEKDQGDLIADATLLLDGQDAKRTSDQGRTRQQGKAFGERLKQARAGDGERATEGRSADTGRDVATAEGRVHDTRSSETRAESRREDARLGRDALSERGEAPGKGPSSGAGAGALRGKGDLKSDADGGGKKDSGGGGDKNQGKDAPFAGGGFRFNPALMAPVPVARPKETSASERLRALANEIAQKIVERVRVGTNAAGMAEFQIDLRSSVLAGLSIKVSGGNGRIRAVFAGSDREVLKLLRENAESLKQSLGGRGLTLEDLRIEERA